MERLFGKFLSKGVGNNEDCAIPQEQQGAIFRSKNNQPIHLPTLNKLIEVTVFKQIKYFLENNFNSICIRRRSFNGHCILMQMTDDWLRDKGKMAGAVLFDLIGHQLLLRKLA